MTGVVELACPVCNGVDDYTDESGGDGDMWWCQYCGHTNPRSSFTPVEMRQYSEVLGDDES